MSHSAPADGSEIPASPPRPRGSPSSSPEGPTRRPSGCSGRPRSFSVSAVLGQRSVVPAAERVQSRDYAVREHVEVRPPPAVRKSRRGACGDTPRPSGTTPRRRPAARGPSRPSPGRRLLGKTSSGSSGSSRRGGRSRGRQQCSPSLEEWASMIDDTEMIT
ncbi:hypothetical protein THAOC_20540 [Thalassiosira oceanica]|uniref:Uncharacterized protein n=1 Tax=Thalassiosira oceanica TaxID=159749 RepID=K0RZM9_THAOC|nr:hypothetical protein THAOC_20540 [Thalassiosira oceanica]|eukprot:EJK59263.1 hypothetical protein THAOC_20540 [Thalassiosira oceanica]